MVRRWHQFRNPWEREYAMRGRMWRGVEPPGDWLSQVPKGGLVLELGCGDGKHVAGLVAAGVRPVGIDFARRALVLARGFGAPLVQADLRALPVADGACQAVAARYALGALDALGRAKAAAEIARVLAPGGVLHMEEFSPADFRFGKGSEVEPRTFERNRGLLTHYFERDEAGALFSGLTLLGTEEIQSVQRARNERLPRHRWRWTFRRHGLGSEKRSSGAAPTTSR